MAAVYHGMYDIRFDVTGTSSRCSLECATTTVQRRAAQGGAVWLKRRRYLRHGARGAAELYDFRTS